LPADDARQGDRDAYRLGGQAQWRKGIKLVNQRAPIFIGGLLRFRFHFPAAPFLTAF